MKSNRGSSDTFPLRSACSTTSIRFLRRYGTTIVPARVRKPDDKAAAEGSVKYVSTWITAALRDRTFFTLDEARRAVIEKLEELNRRPFKKREGWVSAFPRRMSWSNSPAFLCSASGHEF